ncbi:unnamed protein product, partial [Mycena citricolor]
ALKFHITRHPPDWPSAQAHDRNPESDYRDQKHERERGAMRV